MTEQIRPLTARDLVAYDRHFRRHRAESGLDGDIHFMPFEPADEDGPRGLDPQSLERRTDEPGWQRWWVVDTGRSLVGHVNLKGDGLKTGLHRCELGIGLERAYRGSGLGRRLMQEAMTFARNDAGLAWIDLRVFAHNRAGRRLYAALGFVQLGVIADRFRIGGERIDDVIMTLDVA